MAEIFRKGQIVPKRIGYVEFRDRKARHCLVFGVDTSVDGHIFTGLNDGPVFYLNEVKRRVGNGTFKKSTVLIQDVYIVAPTKVGVEVRHGS